MAEMSDGDLKSILSAKIRNVTGYLGGNLSSERDKALRYYRGDKFGNELDGRSQVVSRDVAEAIDAMMPALMKIFTSGDEVVKFEPTGPEDEGAAKQATDYVNWIWMQDNPGFQIFHTWFKDALLQKNGVIKVWWEVSDHVTQESYKGLTDIQLQGLMADPDLEPVEGSQVDYPAPLVSPFALLQPPMGGMPGGMSVTPQAAQPLVGGPPAPGPGGAAPPAQPPLPVSPPGAAGAAPASLLHDIKFTRTAKKGKICIAALPPDEFLLDRRAVDLDIDIGFMAHRRRSTVSELIELFPKKKSIIEDMQGEDGDGEFALERMDRFAETDEYPFRDSGVLDPSMRTVWIIENYLKVDFDGDGVAEWRKVVLGGSDGYGGEILENDEIDDHPFASITPIPMPHNFHGMSIADQTMDLQLIKSTLWRGSLDSMYLQLSPMTEVVVDQVNLDDVINRRPGSVVRVKQPGMMREIVTEPVAEQAFPMIQYVDTVREQRTGVQRFTAGPGADALNNAYTETATGANIVETASQERLELIARIFAETGVKRAFRRILELVCKYQQEAKMIRLRNEWVNMDPSEWNSQMDLTVHVGLGTGNKKEQVGIMTNLLMLAEKLSMSPGYAQIVSPENVYNMCDKLSQASGLKSPVPYFTDPKTVPPQQPPPNPEVMKVQAQAQLQQQEQQADQQQAQAQMQLQAQQAHMEAQLQAAKQQGEARAAEVKLQLEARKIELQHALKVEELKARLALDQARAEAEIAMHREQSQAQLGLEREKFGAQSQLDAQKFSATQGAEKEKFAASQDLEREKAGIGKPKKPARKRISNIERDKNGDIAGALVEDAA